MINSITKSDLGVKGLILAYIYGLSQWEIREGTQAGIWRQELKHRP